MSKKEARRVYVMEQVVEGKMTVRQGAECLGLSERQVKRLKKGMKEKMLNRMRALSILQPWASLVAGGAKRIETRSWPTKFRGSLAIHASRGFTRGARDVCLTHPFSTELARMGIDRVEDLPLGAIIAVTSLVDCLLITGENAPKSPELEFGNYTPGRYAWILGQTFPLQKPVPARGSLGLWTLPPEIEQEMLERLPEGATLWPS